MWECIENGKRSIIKLDRCENTLNIPMLSKNMSVIFPERKLYLDKVELKGSKTKYTDLVVVLPRCGVTIQELSFKGIDIENITIHNSSKLRNTSISKINVSEVTADTINISGVDYNVLLHMLNNIGKVRNINLDIKDYRVKYRRKELNLSKNSYENININMTDPKNIVLLENVVLDMSKLKEINIEGGTLKTDTLIIKATQCNKKALHNITKLVNVGGLCHEDTQCFISTKLLDPNKYKRVTGLNGADYIVTNIDEIKRNEVSPS